MIRFDFFFKKGVNSAFEFYFEERSGTDVKKLKGHPIISPKKLKYCSHKLIAKFFRPQGPVGVMHAPNQDGNNRWGINSYVEISTRSLKDKSQF